MIENAAAHMTPADCPRCARRESKKHDFALKLARVRTSQF
jgi:hypothetical protein